jgi:hypothetical protein
MAGIGEKRRVRYPKVMFIEPQDLPQTTCIIVGLESFLFASVPFWTSRTIWENDRIHLTHCEYPPILFSKNWHGISVGNIHSWFVKNSRLSRKDVPFIQLNAILIMSWKHMKTPWPRPSWPFQVLKKGRATESTLSGAFTTPCVKVVKVDFWHRRSDEQNPNQQKMVGMMRCNGI